MHSVAILDGHSLTLERLGGIADDPGGSRARAEIPGDAWTRVRASRAVLEGLNLESTAYYGINTGFGKLCDVRIDAADVGKLQVNLLRSHAVGVGADVCDGIVRLMLALKIQSLVRGHSAVQPEVVELLLALLNGDVLPCVPARGSVGASGDLAPLSHLSLPLIGEGEARVNGKRMSGGEALAARGLKPVKLGAKDGLALINGTQFMAAHAALLLHRARRLVRVADVAAAMSLEAMRGLATPYDARIHEIRPHPGAQAAARNVLALTAGSSLVLHKGTATRVQDPYSLRCVPQVHGASRDMLAYCERTLEIEMNSTTDNPLVFENGDVVSGGNFHGQPLALTLDAAGIAIAELASISERRTYLLVEGRGGLPPVLSRHPGLSSGMMIVQYTSASLVSENKVLAHPASVDSVPTGAGQEDHVSMGSISGVKAMQILENAENVLAIELLCAAQGMDLQGAGSGGGTAAAHRAIRSVSAMLEDDRSLAPDISVVAELVRSGSLLSSLKEIGHELR